MIFYYFKILKNIFICMYDWPQIVGREDEEDFHLYLINCIKLYFSTLKKGQLLCPKILRIFKNIDLQVFPEMPCILLF